MAYHKFSGTYKSSNQKNRIQYYIYEPESDIRGMVQISHGMCEYIEMYEELVCYLCGHGFLVCGNDHLGHGKSVGPSDEFGYFSPKDGWMHLVKDLKKLNGYVRREYPGIPCCLLGHSMGSFLARAYTECYKDTIDGAVYLGTSGTVFGLSGARAALKACRLAKGGHYRSKQINQLAFGSYNAHYREENDNFSWLCHDENFRKKYVEDERNRFIFTVGGFCDLTDLLAHVSGKGWYQKIPKDFPYLLMAGTEDPVGQYGRGVREVYKKMKKAGCLHVSMRLYEGDRHVLLQENDKGQVMEDMVLWIDRQVL